MKPVWQIGKRALNLLTLAIFAVAALLIVLAAIPFELFHPQWATFAGLFGDTRIERDSYFLLAIVQSGPWLLAGFVLFLGAYLAIEPVPEKWSDKGTDASEHPRQDPED